MTLLEPWFWLFALAAVLGLRLLTPRLRAPAYGVLNLLALSTLVGLPAVVFVFGLAIALWLGARRAWPLAAVTALFVLYKTIMDRGPFLGLAQDGTFFRLLHGIGFSYVFLRALDCLLAARHGERMLDPLSLAGYLAPLHMLAAGPISVYRDHAGITEPPPLTFGVVLAGVNDLTTGLFYKFVLAESVRIFAFGVGGSLISRSWADTALLFVYIFFDFAGYSRVAAAIGRLAGVPTPVNFAAPFASTSITEFWTRWHISLGDFVRRNFYLPLQVRMVRTGGVRLAHVLNLFSLAACFAFVGLWHRFSIRLLLWGASIGILMALEKLGRDRLFARWPWTRSRAAGIVLKVAGPVYVFAVLTTSIHFVIEELLRP